MTLTKKLAIKLHRKLWNWIADETIRRKEVVGKYDYPLFKRKKIYYSCWCCEYAKGDCMNCPIKWSGKSKIFSCLGLSVKGCAYGEYDEWRKKAMRGNWQGAAHWARIIAELPERDERKEQKEQVR